MGITKFGSFFEDPHWKLLWPPVDKADSKDLIDQIKKDFKNL